MKRIKEPSTWAGVGLLIQGAVSLWISKGTDVTAWGTVGAGVSAIIMREKGGVNGGA
jgi:hypothetical protein